MQDAQTLMYMGGGGGGGDRHCRTSSFAWFNQGHIFNFFKVSKVSTKSLLEHWGSCCLQPMEGESLWTLHLLEGAEQNSWCNILKLTQYQAILFRIPVLASFT